MEPILGEDFGDVRLHSEPAAARAAASLKAEAFTLGRDIFLASEKAKFDTPSSLALLGHELSHVSQHRGDRLWASTGVLRAQAEEREAVNNELALRALFHTDQPLAPRTVSLARDFPGRPASDTRARGADADAASIPAAPPLGRGGPPMELARAAVGRPAAGDSPAPAVPSSLAEQPTPETEGREPDVGALARQVYDLIMQRLIVERERAGYP